MSEKSVGSIVKENLETVVELHPDLAALWLGAITYKNPNCLEFYAMRGYVAHCLGQFKEAFEDYETALNLALTTPNDNLKTLVRNHKD